MLKKKIYFFVLFLSSNIFSICAQERTVPFFFEEVYLHMDREVYGQGENIWFKAYVLNAQDNTPIDYSHNLYVELIGPQAKLIKQETVRLENGLGNGDFKLSDSISPGRYRIRAYTNWMRNFGDNFVFEKYFNVLQDSITAPSNLSNHGAAITTIDYAVTTDNVPVLLFFPEGGALVNGISSVIGVKAQDASGHGVAANCNVIDNAGQIVAAFSCDSLGFGSFTLQPHLGQHYQSLLKIGGTVQRYTIPETQDKGFGLHVSTAADTVKMLIAYTNQQKGLTYLVARHGGKSYLRQTVLLNNNGSGGIIVNIPAVKLPEGITAITLYDEQNQPQCERLIYINHADQVKLTVAPEQMAYAPKSEAKIRLNLSSKEKANLSMTVVTSDIPVPSENIISYLELQSEIKGTIEQPNRYFDTTNSKRTKELDLLLLTQGWRDFVWKKLADTALNIRYQPEDGITITGQVTKTWTKKSLSGIDISMRALKAEGQKLFWTTTDSTGHFTIYGAKFYGYQYINFTSRRSDKINRDGESKGASGGYIHVDSLHTDMPAIKPDQLTALVAKNRRPGPIDNIKIESIGQSPHVSDVHNLKEVIIKANADRLSTSLPPEIHAINLQDQKEYSNLMQYLLDKVEGSSPIIEDCRWCSGSPKYLTSAYLMLGREKIMIMGTYVDKTPIDYCTICQDEYLTLPMSKVLKVIINRKENVMGKHISINVILRPGVLNEKDYFDNTMADMVGYYKARVFYKPHFDKLNESDPRINTLHWEPNITTDANGQAVISFYNTNRQGKIHLLVEGMTEYGTPLAATATYEVK